MVVINGSNAVLGRLSSHVAKQALRGERVDIINAESIVIVGNREYILADYKHKRGRKSLRNPETGPKFPRQPEQIVKRAIRTMMNYKTLRGRTALKNVKVYVGVPLEFANSKPLVLENAKPNPRRKTISIKEISLEMGYQFK